jgi:lantibiotic modifying enzyme
MLSAQDCARQQAWVRRSLGRSAFPTVAAGDGAAMEFVRAAADWLLQRAERSDVDGSISWLQITLPEESGEVLPLPPTLYGGLAGMLLVFSAFARELACSACEDARLRLRRMLRADVERLLAQGEDGSLFQGCAGPLYALLQDARLHADTEQLAWVRERACDLGRHPLAAGAHDVIAGRAGVMLLLCDLLDAGENARLGAQLTALGEALMAARRSERCSWPSEHGEDLGGFSHGNSGIAHALIRAGERLRRADFIAVGVEALAFEDGRFAEAECNWPDLRRQTGAVFNLSWCNGSIGYLLTRAAHHGRLSSSAHERFDAALQALLQQTDFGDDSLCHGSAGVLDALVELHRTRPAQVSAQQIRAQLQRLLSARPPRSGSRDCDAPGLMTGLAGMAYAVLRSLRPHLPCVLTVLR